MKLAIPLTLLSFAGAIVDPRTYSSCALAIKSKKLPPYFRFLLIPMSSKIF